MKMNDEKLLTPAEAALFMGVTAELIFQFTKNNFGKTCGLRSLKTIELNNKTYFAKQELINFNTLLNQPWCEASCKRPAIPKAIQDHLRAESYNQCARCSSGIGVETAHIIPWVESRSHHPNNLIRICTACHNEHDKHQSLTTAQLSALKQKLVTRTRANLLEEPQTLMQCMNLPNPSQQFFGRETELQALNDSIQANENIMITGLGGIGKTTLLIQALNQTPSKRKVIWCEISQYSTCTALVTALQSFFAIDNVSCSEAELATRFDNVNACVIFDGIEQSSLNNLDEFEDLLVNWYANTNNTLFILTSQVTLYRFPNKLHIELIGLDSNASQTLFEQLQPTQEDAIELITFCDGHALTIKLASALAKFYNGPSKALAAIKRKGAKHINLPGRKNHSRHTSLELCMKTAYEALSPKSQQLLWSLALLPAGIFTTYLNKDWIKIDDTEDLLPELRQWHFLELINNNNSADRTKILEPIRQFIIEQATAANSTEFNQIQLLVIRQLQLMVTVFELKFETIDKIPHIVHRYGEELPNLLHTISLAKTRIAEPVFVNITLDIIAALMRYYFVLGLAEEGARVMQEAACLAIQSKNLERATGLVMQLICLAVRSSDSSLITDGLVLVSNIEKKLSTTSSIDAKLAMCRAMATHKKGQTEHAVKYARLAVNGFKKQLQEIELEEVAKCNKDILSDTRNNISHAQSILGETFLAQGKYNEAAIVYRQALKYENNGAIAVNKGQLLHQLGNCESELGNHITASQLYVEAADIFNKVGMQEYLSNSFGEIGYCLLDINMDNAHELNIMFNADCIENALIDLFNDVSKLFRLNEALIQQFASNRIRKLFGMIILLSLTNNGAILHGFSNDLAESISMATNEIAPNKRSHTIDYLFNDICLLINISLTVAQAEFDFEEAGDIRHETFSELLNYICTAHDWMLNTVRLLDWLENYTKYRWSFNGADKQRLQEFVTNKKNGLKDELTLTRQAPL